MRGPALAQRRPRSSAPLVAAALGAGIALAGSPPALATEFEVQGTTAAQGYQVSSPWGDVTVDFRRVLQTVGLGVYNLQGRYVPGEADYRMVVMLRLDADFGINGNLPAAQAGGETNYVTAAGSGVRYVPGLQVAPVDLMYGYVEGRNLAHGLFGFRVGRQYLTDVLGFWSFDGGLVRLRTPWFVQVEAYGGLEERGGLPLSTSRFEQQGIWRGSHADFNTGNGSPSVVDYPSFLYAEAAPAFGFAVESNGPSWVHSRLSYRHVYNTGTAVTMQFPDPYDGGYHAITGLRTSQERIGWSGDVSRADLGAIKGGVTYDLYNQLVSSYYAGVEAYLGKRVTLGADADFFVPTFDADSIFNWFTHGPTNTLTARVAARFTKRFEVTASGGVRLWETYGDPTAGPGGLSNYGAGECRQVAAAYAGSGITCAIGQVAYDASSAAAHAYQIDPKNRVVATTFDALGNVNARYRLASGEVTFKGMLENGVRGSREGGDLAAEKRWDGGRFTTGARVSVYGWADPDRPDRDAVSFAYVLAGGLRPGKVAGLRLEWEHDVNRLVGQRFRVMALLDVLVIK